MNPRFQRNNFDLLRLVFAAAVFLYHCYALTLDPRLLPLGKYLSAEFAVRSFFAISGFLIFMSYERSVSLREYFEKRFRRIYPAYFCVILLTVIAGLLAGASHVLEYLAANLVFLNFLRPSLPGLFSHNPVAVVNGALWTIKVEVVFYLLVPALVWLLRGSKRLWMLGALYAVSIVWHQSLSAKPELARQLPGQLSYFMSGAFLYYYFAEMEKRPLAWFLIACAGYFSGLNFLQPLCLGVIVIWLACFAWNPGRVAKHGDFSYGVYIYHFPVVQSLVWLGYFERNAWASVLLAGIITGCLAFLSWRLVEKPFLKKSSHYLRTASPAPLARHTVA